MLKITISNPNVNALLNVAHDVLDKYGRDGIPEKIKGQATLSLIKHLTNDTYFSVCNINDLAKMNSIMFSAEHKEFFQTLHCVRWDEMHNDTKEYLMALLIDYFKGNIAMANSNI